MIWQWLWSLLLAVLILWAAGSAVIALCRPWRDFTGEDAWFAWLILFGWPFILIFAVAELMAEQFWVRPVHDEEDDEEALNGG